MGLTNLTFFLFVAISLILYYVLPRKISYIALWGTSLFFLFYQDLTFFNIICVLCLFLITYFSGILIKKYPKKGKVICVLAVILILTELTILKYSNLLIETANIFFNKNIPYTNIPVPLGLSYYSLMMIAYVVSIYWGSFEEEKNPIKLNAFMVFFPALTSGPISNYNEFKPNLDARNKINSSMILNGCIRSLWGLFKVLVISTRLHIFVNSVYDNLIDYNGLFVLLAIFAYTFELYTNFSGSIDIIMGVSHMFGISLKENFNNPFSSTSITEFWRRWHITLGEWLRNYLFYPMLKSNSIQKLTKIFKEKFGKIGKKIPMYLCMLVLWVAIGIWHGGAYKYILASGILQFIFIVCEDLIPTIKKENKLLTYLRRVRTFSLFSLSMVFFRARTIHEGMNILRHLFCFTGTAGFRQLGLTILDYLIIIVSLIILLVVDNKWKQIVSYIGNKEEPFKLGIIFSFIVIILLLGMYGLQFTANDFIYGQF